MIDTRSTARLLIGATLVASTFTIAACGSSEKVTRTTTTEQSTVAVPAPMPSASSTTTTTTRQTNP